jgi:cystathionine beta-lyase
MAPSKTFNIAGLGSSVCYIGNESLRKQYFGWIDAMGVAYGNIFAYTAAEAAFSYGEDWLNQMLEYLKSNIALLESFVKENLPKVKMVLPEASFLAWLDFSDCGKTHKELSELLINKAGVVLNDGTTFAPKSINSQYDCCFRINLGCPKSTLTEALQRIADCLKD